MLLNLSPENIWKHFYELTQIPRPSGHEAAVIAYLAEFAKTNGLEHLVDDTGNLIIKKAAATGREGASTVILQTHVDMVPQKNSDKVHDFVKDPIEAIIDGDWVRANETTLGADNGMGIAATLAVLESGAVSHGPLEALFTISEETGMDGAFGLKPGILKGTVLLNLDSEEEGELFIGCAGGVDVNIDATYKTVASEKNTARLVRVSGLKGGHSGLDINLGRANANLVLVDLARSLASDLDISVQSLKGGNLRNAIPREAELVIYFAAGETGIFEASFREHTERIKKNFAEADGGMKFELSEVTGSGVVMDAGDQKKIFKLLAECPVGVISMSEQMPGIVQTSNNMSILVIDQGKLELKMLLRSSSDAEKDSYAKKILEMFEAAQSQTSLSGAYPGWLPDNQSAVLAKARESYRRLFGREPKVQVIHAGLECGIIGGIYPGLDMISFGPTIKYPHSPDEKVLIPSVGKFWDFLKELLESV
ncbi:MAG: aminoacyl-histidine dipeptidase [Bacteroidales bacterium]|nr:aminoacyl-histidine dipeptidase [Bacteroidales bacterium]